jgi:hypothetical protein
MLPSSASQLIRFDLFELDLRAGELRKRGTKIRLQSNPSLFWRRCWKILGRVTGGVAEENLPKTRLLISIMACTVP